jgi:FixJ family two-component response regulator
VLDYYPGDMSGLELQSKLNGLGIEFPLISLSGKGDIALCVKAMKAAADVTGSLPQATARLIRPEHLKH